MSARGLAVASLAMASLVAAGAAEAAPLVRATPGLFPAFREDAPDYVVRCAGHKKVHLSIAASSGTRVAVGSRSERANSYGVDVGLKPGRQVSIRVRSGASNRTHHVRCLPPDFLDWTVERSGTPQARWYLVTPIRLGYRRPGYTIVFDRNGVPVWWMREAKGSPFTGTLLPDGGIAWFPYLGTPFGIDKNRFEEHALDGSLVRTFSTVGTLTDHHELQVLPNNHVVLISYVPRDHVNLRQLNPSLPADATVVEGVVQEVDRKGKVVWSWSTKGHIALSESSRWYRAKPRRLRDGRLAYDIVHLNSVDVQGDRVVVSMRHTDAVYEIDKTTHAIMWKLGGTKTLQSLTFANDPFGAQSFGGQHDARLSADGQSLTLFDNATLRGRPPRAVLYSIDRVTRRAQLVQSLSDPAVRESLCCGSARLLPGGHWAISWGGDFVVTEADSSGRRVFALGFAGERQSYRVDPVLPGRLSASALRGGMDAQAP
jgi:Arylsulfotransferase (ASST)